MDCKHPSLVYVDVFSLAHPLVGDARHIAIMAAYLNRYTSTFTLLRHPQARLAIDADEFDAIFARLCERLQLDLREAQIVSRRLYKLLERVGATYREPRQSKKGRPPLVWFDNLVETLITFAPLLDIPITTRGAVDGEETRFVAFVREIEKVFPREARSRTSRACAKRIERSRRRLRPS